MKRYIYRTVLGAKRFLVQTGFLPPGDQVKVVGLLGSLHRFLPTSYAHSSFNKRCSWLDAYALSAHYLNGVLTGDTTFIRSTSIEMPDELPKQIQLSAYPNPFNPATTLNYEITEAGHTMVRVFDLHGREVATLIDQVQTAGAHQITFDARSLSSGIYLVELQSAGLRTVQKITLMK